MFTVYEIGGNYACKNATGKTNLLFFLHDILVVHDLIHG